MILLTALIFSTTVKISYPNNLVLIVTQKENASVNAFHVLIKNRMFHEKKSGESFLLQSLILKNPVLKELEYFGGTIKTVDDPYLPYDDYYNSRDYAYIRLEILSDYYKEGLLILKKIITEFPYTEEDLSTVRENAKILIREKEKIPQEVASNVFYSLLFEGLPISKPIEGYLSDLGTISLQDIKGYYEKAYTPENLIISVVSHKHVKELITEFNSIFSDFLSKKSKNIEKFEITHRDLGESLAKEVSVNHERADIIVGKRIPGGINNPDLPKYKVLSLVLSKRLQNELREKRGLAYRLGSSLEFFGNPSDAVLKISMGTSSDKVEESVQGIFEVMNSIYENPPSYEEIIRVIQSYKGVHLRFRQRKINLAYYQGFYEYVGLGLEYDTKELELISEVSPSDLRELAKGFFNNRGFYIVKVANF